MYKKLLAVILISLLVFSGCGPRNENIKSVGIKDLSSDPGAYTGKILIKGVVQAVDEKRFLFRLIDEEEYKSCGLNPCGTAGIITIYTPDSSKPAGKTPSDYTYDVKMPKVEDRVTVEGEVKKTDMGYAFEVEKVLKGSDALIVKK
ncbi:MAG: hypothetical protein ACOYWZ_17435 [Bacillota bacterium]